MRASRWALSIGLIAGVACDDAVETDTEDTSGTPTACAWDEDDTPELAGVLTGGAIEAFLCPVGDQDWYQIEVPANTGLGTVSLSLDAPISPIQLSYTVYDSAGVSPVGGPAASESATAGDPLVVTHGMLPGTYLLQVRDVGGDGEDVRHAYQLTFGTSADPDGNEPNDDGLTATSYGTTPAVGYVAARGDEDWYEITAAARSLLRISLTANVATFEPSVRVLDAGGEELVMLSNPAGSREATDLSYVQALTEGGTYHVVVSDDDDLDQDPTTPYTLSLTVEADPDGNEGNDHPGDATALSARSCTGSWSSWSSNNGWIATSGDVDWYRLDLTGCAGSVLEAQVALDSVSALPSAFDLELRMLREVAGETCVIDQDCTALSTSCSDHLDCAGLGNVCLPSHVCGGAGLCLPSGSCGANLLTEVAPATDPGQVALSAPLSGESAVWLAVSDHRGDAWSADHRYTMQSRVRVDPDPYEPNDVYTGGEPTSNAAGYHTPFSADIPVHDCTMGDCCDSTTWEVGYLSWAYDQDWFRYPHPCPGEDCMVRVHYQLAGGPVDPYLRIFQNNSMWYDNLADATDQGDWSAVTDTFGGLAPTDECLYAYQGHTGSPFWYHLSVRDTTYVNASAPTGGTWDHSTSQSYGLCVEKVGATCVDPCFLYNDGCGVP